MSELDGEYTVTFGTYETNGTGSTPAYRPWQLRHCDISMSVYGEEDIIGIPARPARITNVFDKTGPVREFKIEGTRIAQEEEFSNFDFLHTQFNVTPTQVSSTIVRNETRVGLEWLFSNLQVRLRGYELRINSPVAYINAGGNLQGDSRFLQGSFNVGLADLQMRIGDGYNTIDYTLTLLERTTYGLTEVYQPWYRDVI